MIDVGSERCKKKRGSERDAPSEKREGKSMRCEMSSVVRKGRDMAL